MSTTEATTPIDDKKAEESGTSTDSPDFKGFVNNYLSSIIFTIGVSIFIIGGLGLYTTKVAQANILPDDINLAPYTVFDRIVNDGKDFIVDMNIMRPSFFSKNTDTLSQKVTFNSQEYLDSFNNSFLCSLKNAANPNTTNEAFANFPLYLSFVCDNLAAKNFLAINTIFFYLSYLPESGIMILYGLLGIIIWVCLYFFNIWVSIFYHIVNIPQLFRTVYDDKKDNTYIWESNNQISLMRFIKLILFLFIWLPLGTISALFIMPIFFTFYGLLAPLFASYKMTESSGKKYKSFNVFDFIKDTFFYKKFFFIILVTLSLFSNGIKKLGTGAIVGILFAVVFAYYVGLYVNPMPEPGTDGFSLKIKTRMTRASVNDTINFNDIHLVEICNPIPMINETMEKIPKGTLPRELTKSNNIGGNNEDSGYDTYDTSSPEVELIPLEKNTLNNKISKESNQLNKTLQKDRQPSWDEYIAEAQKGGTSYKHNGVKKYKNYKHTKKYNIRWV